MKHQGIRAQVHDDGTVMIYGFVGDSYDELDAKTIINQINALGKRDQLNVHINSGGGFVFEGLAIYNYLDTYEGQVNFYIDGIAASMASIIAMAKGKVFMPENALMMIHNPWDISIGDSEQLRKDAEILDKTKASLVSIYVAKTGLSESEISDMMNQETWLSAQEAVDMGFADEITSAEQVAASIDLSNFKNVPEELTRRMAVASARPVSTPSGSAPSATNEDVTMTPEEKKAAEAKAAADQKAAKDKAEADQKAAVETATKAERKRTIDIKSAVSAAKLKPEVAETLIADGVSIENAREQIIDKLADNDNLVIDGDHSLQMGAEAIDKFRIGATAAILVRAGYANDDDTGNEFRGFTLRELARESLALNNVNTRGMSAMTMVGAAFTHSTGDFDNILADVANKAMLRGYDEADETFQQWTSTGTLTDFKASKRVDLNSFPSLRQVRPGAEYKYVTIGDRGETTQLATYGELFSINRQTIINDDLGAFTRIPLKFGKAAVRTVGDLVYAILTGNPNMADGTALFHATHNNLNTGAAILTATVDVMDAGMAKQKDRDNNATALNIALAYLIVPRTLKAIALLVRDSDKEVVAAKTATTPNTVRNTFEVVADARLDASSTSNWYGAASPGSTDTIEVSYLDGNQAPMLEQKAGWSVDGTEFKVRIDAGVKALAWEGLAKNPN